MIRNGIERENTETGDEFPHLGSCDDEGLESEHSHSTSTDKEAVTHVQHDPVTQVEINADPQSRRRY